MTLSYNVIFSRVVAYSKQYQAIQELAIPEGSLEGHGTFKLPDDDILAGEGVLSPVFVGTLLHAAGFIANSHVQPSEACICRGRELSGSLQRYRHSTELLLYYSLLDHVEGTTLGEAYAVNSGGVVVVAVEGMLFKKLNLKSFQGHLSRSANYRRPMGEMVKPREALTTQEPSMRDGDDSNPKRDASTVVQYSSDETEQIVLEITSHVCELSLGLITKHSKLADIGVDSLTKLELRDTLRRSILTISLNTTLLMDIETVKDLQDCVLLANQNVSPQKSLPERSRSPKADTYDNNAHRLQSLHMDTRRTSKDRSCMTPSTRARVPENDMARLMTIIDDITGVPEASIPTEATLRSLGIDSLMSIELREVLSDQSGQGLSQDEIDSDLTLWDLGRLVFSRMSSAITPMEPI